MLLLDCPTADPVASYYWNIHWSTKFCCRTV